VISGSWPEDYRGPIVIRGYQGGTYEQMIAKFHEDALIMLEQGFVPAGQHYVEGSWSIWRGILAAVTIPLLIGAVMWVQMLLERPIGTLTVTYVHQARG
jgi:hypothetical protein